MLALAARPTPSARSSLLEDGFAPIAVPQARGNQESCDLAGLDLPQPVEPPAPVWLDDPSYDSAAFLAGL
jgi:hypothetical protein